MKKKTKQIKTKEFYLKITKKNKMHNEKKKKKKNILCTIKYK